MLLEGERGVGLGLRMEKTYLGAKLDVGCNDGDFYYGDDAHQTDYAQEPKHVVVSAFILPHAPEHKEQLDKDYRKGHETRKQYTIKAFGVPGLLRNLAGDAVCFRGVLVWLTTMKSIPITDIDKW